MSGTGETRNTAQTTEPISETQMDIKKVLDMKILKFFDPNNKLTAIQRNQLIDTPKFTNLINRASKNLEESIYRVETAGLTTVISFIPLAGPAISAAIKGRNIAKEFKNKIDTTIHIFAGSTDILKEQLGKIDPPLDKEVVKELIKKVEALIGPSGPKKLIEALTSNLGKDIKKIVIVIKQSIVDQIQGIVGPVFGQPKMTEAELNKIIDANQKRIKELEQQLKRPISSLQPQRDHAAEEKHLIKSYDTHGGMGFKKQKRQTKKVRKTKRKMIRKRKTIKKGKKKTTRKKERKI